ncbi:MAG: hypothetical protein CML99_02310 [Rhodobiaceae bacterium]|nr:hypothetical protein [Rhodobiaceae bacterium]
MSEPEDGEREGGPVSTFVHHGKNEPAHGRHEADIVSERRVGSYWAANLRLLGLLLLIWAFVSFGLSIFFVDALNEIGFFGFKLGFWWAQQGSIYAFIGLIFYYVHAMKRLERKYGVDDDA